MTEFIRNCWYVAGWNRDLPEGELLAREIIGERLVIFRAADGALAALEDRCPHRWAPLSAGRLEGELLRCMYHGLCFDGKGTCVSVPGDERTPSRRLSVRTYPVVESSGWIWVWMGDAELADRSQIPEAWGLDNPEWHLKEGAIDYDADYQLINDNLLDLSHLDYLHEDTLGAATGGCWSDEAPDVSEVANGVYVSRWLRDARPPYLPDAVDTHTSYHFLLPGIFIQTVRIFPPGTADSFAAGNELPAPLTERVDQQAVTPVAPDRSRYYYAAGVGAQYGDEKLAEQMRDGVLPAFMQDKTMIEAQARVIAATDPRRAMRYVWQDKAPSMFRKLIRERIAAETD